MASSPGVAPEQARGDAIDARADRYTFCVSLWEGLHGALPSWTGDDAAKAVPRRQRGAAAHRCGSWPRSPEASRRAPTSAGRRCRRSSITSTAGSPDLVASRTRLGGIATAGLASAAVLVATRTDREDPCAATVAPVASAWNGGFAAARPEYENALAVSEKVFGTRSLDYTNIERTLAAGLSLQGSRATARPRARTPSASSPITPPTSPRPSATRSSSSAAATSGTVGAPGASRA